MNIVRLITITFFSLALAQPTSAQTLSSQELSAISSAINLLLLSDCRDDDKDTLCDMDEMTFFGSLDEDANSDFDGDGLNNGDELNVYKSNPNNINTDGDLLGDFAEFLIGSSIVNAFSTGSTLGGDTPQDKATMHVLNRLTFGPTLVEMNQVAAQGGIQAWITDQLNPIGLPPAPPRAGVSPLYGNEDDIYPKPYDCSSHITPDPAQAKRDCFVSRRQDEVDVVAAFRPMHSTRQLQSRMAMFWDNHFNTDLSAHGRGLQELYDEDFWFVNAFGNFRTLLDLNTRNYTMLEYLDLDDNRRSNPNENFPREVMELHSVGINGGYTATDIAQLAYILTGWDHDDAFDIIPGCDEADIITCGPYVSRYGYRQEANNDNGGTGETGLDESARFNAMRIFKFNVFDHDDGLADYDGDSVTNVTKTLYAGTAFEITISSETGAAGENEGIQALDFLATHPNTATFICTKLAQEFVADTPQPITISDCATVFLANTAAANQIGLVLANLFASAEFNDPATERSKLKDTQEVMFSLGRMLDWDAGYFYLNGNGTLNYGNAIANKIREAEQRLFYKAEPTGYYETANNWLNTNIAVNQFQEMNDMVFDDDQTQSFVTYFNALGLTTSGEIMTHLFQMMLGGHYDEHDVKLGTDILHKVDPDDPSDPRLQAFDLNDPSDVIRYHLGGGSNGIPDSDDRIRALVARLAALPQFHLH